jgi:hypothetical protein
MSKLEQIEKSIEALTDEEMKAFAAWFDALRWERWDRQIERDGESGELDRVLDLVRDEIAQGKSSPL